MSTKTELQKQYSAKFKKTEKALSTMLKKAELLKADVEELQKLKKQAFAN